MEKTKPERKRKPKKWSRENGKAKQADKRWKSKTIWGNKWKILTRGKAKSKGERDSSVKTSWCVKRYMF